MTQSNSELAVQCYPSETVRMPAGQDAYCAFAGLENRRLHTVAWRILRSREESEDAVQEAHLRALTHLHQYSGQGSLGAWVQQITAREALTRLRRRVPSAAVDDLPLPYKGPSPEQEAVGGQMLKLILAAVQNLPPKYRTVFLLRECSEVDSRGVAACLGLSVQCVKTRLCRAKALLRERLRPHLQSRLCQREAPPHWHRVRTQPGCSAPQ